MPGSLQNKSTSGGCRSTFCSTARSHPNPFTRSLTHAYRLHSLYNLLTMELQHYSSTVVNTIHLRVQQWPTTPSPLQPTTTPLPLMPTGNGATASVTNVVQQRLLPSPSSGYVVDVYVPSAIFFWSIALTPPSLCPSR
jgi:hypothetical protein